MIEFLILFAKVLGVVLWILCCIGLMAFGASCVKAKHGLSLIAGGLILIVLGFTFEIYGLQHWWLKP